MKNFATPHCHVQSLDTGATAEDFVAREAELETGVVVATDHGTLAACRAVYDLAHDKKHKDKHLTPILGVEAYMRDDDCPYLAAAGLAKEVYTPSDEKGRVLAERYPTGTYRKVFKYGHLCLHALNQIGYETIAERLSHADGRAEQHGSERKPLFSWADLEAMAGGVTMTSGCLIGVVARHLLERDDRDTAMRYYERLRAIAGPGNFYVELFPHDCSRKWVEGVFLTMADGQKLRYYHGKKLLVREAAQSETVEIAAEELVRLRIGGKGWLLVGRKDRSTIVEMEPQEIVAVESVRDFVENECRPWARGVTDIQAAINRFMLAMARRYGDPILVSDDAHYARPEQKILQEVRLAQSSGGLRFWGSYHRYTSAEAFAHFHHTLGTSERDFEGWVDNSAAWAARFKDFRLDYEPSLPVKFYPEDTVTHVRGLIQHHGRMRWDDPVRTARLRRELELYTGNGMDVLPYFFMAEEACAVAARAGVLNGLGRGSAAGTYLAYLLNITHVDPLRRNLSLERFMTPDRIRSKKLPDIDLDFADRDVLVGPEGWLWKRFGDHAVQISTMSTLHLSQGAQDVARALMGHVPPAIMALTARFQKPPQNVDDVKFIFGYTTEEGVEIQGSIVRDQALQQYVKDWPSHWDILKNALGLPRQMGRHPCGFVVANRTIHKFIPLTSVSGVKVTQYSAPAVEACGGVKMDFLGVNTLSDIQECVRFIQERSRVEIPAETQIDGLRVPGLHLVPWEGRFYDVYDLPEEEEICASIARPGMAEKSIFQFGSDGAAHLLRLFNHKRPDGRYILRSIYDLAVFTALDRPGGLDKEVSTPDAPGKTHTILAEYARRARGMTPSPDLPAFMTELFPETYGVMVFQEQLQQAYQQLTGCSGTEAEEFRSNIAKKKVDKVQQAWTYYYPRASEKIGADNAKTAWAFFEAFARYGFNLAHAFCYAQTGYICAWMKTRFPREWWCAVMHNAVLDDKNEMFSRFWRRCSDMIDMPDLTRTANNFQLVGDRIVAPVQVLKGVGPKAHEELVRNGPYQDVRDLVVRLHAACVKAGGYVQRKPTKAELKKNPNAPMKAVFKPARSSVNAGTIAKLIAAGAMDRMFPAGVTDLLSQIDHFLTVFQEVTGKKMAKKQRIALQGQFGNLSPLGRFLQRRAVLPVYAEDLRPLAALNPRAEISGSDLSEWRRQGRLVATGAEIGLCETLPPPPGGFERAAVGVVTELKVFRTKATGRPMARLTLDVDGETHTFVAFSGEDGQLPKALRQDLQGVIVVVSITRRKVQYGFNLDDLVVLERLGVAPEDEEGLDDDGERDDVS